MGAKAYVYLRVSTDDQAKEGNGLDAQRRACRVWCEARGFEVAGEYADEGVSGSKPLSKRPALLSLIQQLEEGSVLLVAKRDRLARGMEVGFAIDAEVRAAGGRVASAAGEGTDEGDGDPRAQLMRRMIDAFAEFERAVIAERVTAALASRKARGLRVTGRVYGYNLEGENVVRNETEQAVIARMRELRDAGAGYHAVAGVLERDGVASKDGKRWTGATVRRILKREVL